MPAALIAEHGAVSEEVAAAMAEGVSHRFGTELGVAVTGVAGPDGGSDDKPVGTHWIGVALRGHPARGSTACMPTTATATRPKPRWMRWSSPWPR